MVIAGGLHAEYYLTQGVPRFERIDLFDQALEAGQVIGKDQAAPERLPLGGTEEGVVLVLGDIDPHDQVVT